MSFLSPGRIWLIAANTFLEAVRQKFFNSLLLIAIALVASSTFFQQFDFGTSELKFIADFGFGALFFFGSILAITATTQLFFNEIENRTALTMLAKPVHKFDFLAGKLLGVQLLMLSFVLLISLVLAGMLYWRETVLMEQLDPEVFSGGRIIRYSDIFLFGFLQWLKFGLLGAMTLFVASFSNTSLYTIIVSFCVLIVCQLQYIARDAYADLEHGVGRLLVHGLGLIFPNFQLFNVGDQLLFTGEASLPAGTALQISLYAVVYITAFLLLAQLSFRRREI
ncbi:ABC transporter permease [Coraliomargarita sinensis]|uniref:ABC transporter permease n=1 Tax=Coraliomargarita sinensis TaxID=2174842 RepID=A0A317ZJT6_9BACT|nr:ABC transporter permease subunit [Coraliomargarita sinensis]PXA03621.1 ABC transporter permease [Coraliomargarita sinensis]